MSASKSTFPLNAAYAAASVVVGLPSALILARRLSTPCTLSSEQLQYTFLVWGSLVIISQPIFFRAFAIPWRRIFTSLLLQLMVVLLLAIALPNMDLGTEDRWRQKRTMADFRWMAQEIDEYKSRTGRYPIAKSPLELARLIGKRLPTTDAWGNPLRVTAGPGGYRVVSYGVCGEPDSPPTKGVLKDPHGDLILENGTFITYPMGLEPQR